jgi:hypothetical protein
MKTNTTRRILLSVAAAAALAIAAGTSGCLVVAAGAGAGAAVAYVRGQLEANVNGTYENTIAATNKALQQLSIAKVNEKQDALITVITARNAADKKIEIRLERLARELTKVRIRVGLMGDEPLSIAILDKVKANL